LQDSIYDDFAAAFSAEVAKLQPGIPTDSGVTQGPLINESGFAKVK
jgi:succinate-semialdehyde dehydrogenase/glutarate-semialdehyde dehydrogenase